MAEQDSTGGILPMYLSGQALATGAAVALGTGLLAGLLPAVTAMRLSVVDALRRI
jgi:ABC-type antimicrobial peptide transport system permease subunit